MKEEVMSEEKDVADPTPTSVSSAQDDLADGPSKWFWSEFAAAQEEGSDSDSNGPVSTRC